jgi:glutamate-ammonia-ligase adenylyltransferase
MRAADGQGAPPSGLLGHEAVAGGLVDIEFAAQYLQLIHAAAGGPLRASTPPRRWRPLAEAGLAIRPLVADLETPGGCSRTCRSCSRWPSPDAARHRRPPTE